MGDSEYRSLELAKNPVNDSNVYMCEIDSGTIKITASILPPLEIDAKPDDFLEVLVCHVESTAKFHVQLKHNDVMDLETKMALVYNHPKPPKDVPNLQRGQYCAVKYDKDQLWYRAVVMNRISPTFLEAYFIDYGRRLTVLISSVKELHPECSLLPPQAIECKLRDVEDKNDAELIVKFQDIVKNNPMVIRLHDKEDSALLVTLYQVVGDSDVNVNDYLLGRGPAPVTKHKIAVPTATAAKPLETTTTSALATGQVSGNVGAVSKIFNGGNGGRCDDNRQQGFGERTGTFGERPRGNFGGYSGPFHGGYRGQDRGGRESYSGSRGDYGDRGGRFGNDYSDRDGGDGNDKTGSFCGDGSRNFNNNRVPGDRFVNNRGMGHGGFNRNMSRSGFSNLHNASTASKGVFDASGGNATPQNVLCRPAVNINDRIIGKIIQPKSPYEFWITTALVSGFNTLPDAMWDYSKKPGFAVQKNVTVDSSCIVLVEAKAGDQYPIYCRGVITRVFGDTCDVWLVDYAETKAFHPIVALYEVPAQFTKLPWQAIKCKLDEAGEIRSQFEDATKKKAFVSGVNHKNATATVKGFDNDAAVVEVKIGENECDLLKICKSFASGALDAFGMSGGM